MNSKNNQNEINVGVDTGKTQLDIYIRPLDIYFSVTNDDEGIEKAVKKLKKYNPTRIVIEATGRLEHGFIVACAKAKLPFTVLKQNCLLLLQIRFTLKSLQEPLAA